MFLFWKNHQRKEEKKRERVGKKKTKSSIMDVAPVPVELTSALDLTFNAKDQLPVAANALTAEQKKLQEEETAACAKHVWWDCTSENTNGKCRYSSEKGQCMSTLTQRGSYYEQWLEVFGPFYSNLNRIDEELAQKTPSKRSLSVTRSRN